MKEYRVYRDQILANIPGNTSDRNREIVRRYLDGEAATLIAHEYQISYERTAQIIRKICGRVLEDAADPLGELSVRVRNGLKNAGIRTHRDALDAYEAKGEAFFLSFPNFGLKSLNELREFLGVTKPARIITEPEYRRARAIVALYEAQRGGEPVRPAP